MPADTLATFPYVVVRLACTMCSRIGSYRLARLADKYGAAIGMDELLEHLAGDCRHWRPRHPYQPDCGAHFVDLPRGGPPDLPPGARSLRVIGGGKKF